MKNVFRPEENFGIKGKILGVKDVEVHEVDAPAARFLYHFFQVFHTFSLDELNVIHQLDQLFCIFRNFQSFLFDCFKFRADPLTKSI